MENILQVNATTGFADELQPYLRERLAKSGWALVKVSSSKDMEEAMWSVATEIGPALSDSIRIHRVGSHIIESTREDKKLPVHTEGSSYQHSIIPFLALGCIAPSTTGGETRVFDGRKAVQLVKQTPGLEDVMIEYSTLTTPEVSIERPLIAPGFGALRYRGQVASNYVVRSGSLDEDELYRQIDEKLEQCVILEHHWEVGDLLFLNNRITLHDRLPFSGYRRILRIRYNDENFPRYCYI